MRSLFLISLLTFSPFVWTQTELCEEPDAHPLPTFISNMEICTDKQFLKEAKLEYESYHQNSLESNALIGVSSIRGRLKDLNVLKKMIFNGEGRVSQKVNEALRACGDVICVLTKALGSEESAYRALNVAHRSSYHVSLKQPRAEGEHLWTTQELRDLNYSVNVMPKHLLGSRSLGPLFNLPDKYIEKGKEKASAWAQAGMNKNGTVHFHDHIRTHGKVWPVHVMIHEMAHHHDFDSFSDSNYGGPTTAELEGFYKINQWGKQKRTTYENGYSEEKEVWVPQKDRPCFPTDHAGESPLEDYAEAISLYIIRPNFLMNECPETYKFMKEVTFKGREYKNPDYGKMARDYILSHTDKFSGCVSQGKVSIHCRNDVQNHLLSKTKLHDFSCSNKEVPDYKAIAELELNDLVIPSKIELTLAPRLAIPTYQRPELFPARTRQAASRTSAASPRVVATESPVLPSSPEVTSASAPKLSEIKVDYQKVFMNCIGSSAYNVKMAMKQESFPVFMCEDALLNELKSKGYKVDSQYYFFNRPDAFKDDKFVRFYAAFRKGFEDSKNSTLKRQCQGNDSNCLKSAIKKKLQAMNVPDSRELEIFVDAIHSNFKSSK